MINTLNKISPWLVAIGMLSLLTGIVLPFFTGLQNTAYCWVYATGAFVLLAGRLISRLKTEDLRLRRLLRMETWSAIIFCVGAFFLFYNKGALRDCLAFTLAGALLQVYASLMIGLRMKKLASEDNQKG